MLELSEDEEFSDNEEEDSTEYSMNELKQKTNNSESLKMILKTVRGIN